MVFYLPTEKLNNTLIKNQRSSRFLKKCFLECKTQLYQTFIILLIYVPMKTCVLAKLNKVIESIC